MNNLVVWSELWKEEGLGHDSLGAYWSGPKRDAQQSGSIAEKALNS